MMWPFVMTRSKAGGAWACKAAAVSRRKHKDSMTRACVDSIIYFLSVSGPQPSRATVSAEIPIEPLVERRANAFAARRAITAPRAIQIAKRQPFVHREMSGNKRDDLHQRHRDCDYQAEGRDGALGNRERDQVRPRAGQRQARGAGSSPSDGAGDRSDFGHRNQDRIPQQHTDGSRDADTEDRGRRSLISGMNDPGTRVDHAAASHAQRTGGWRRQSFR